MRQKVALAGALVHDPRLIILDEPLTGLDALSARHVKGLLRERVRAGCTVIMTTHILEVAERMADRIGVIAAGRLVAEGTLDRIAPAERPQRHQPRGHVHRAGRHRGRRRMSSAAALTWFARHEIRLAWREWLGDADRRPAQAKARRRHRPARASPRIMHLPAYAVIGRFADLQAPLDKSDADRHHRDDLPGLGADAVAGDRIGDAGVLCPRRSRPDHVVAGRRSPTCSRCGSRAIALSVTAMALLLSTPFVDVLVIGGGMRWLSAFGVVVAIGLSAAAVAIAMTIVLFRLIGPSRTRLRRADPRRHHRRRLCHRAAGRGDPVLRHAVAVRGADVGCRGGLCARTSTARSGGRRAPRSATAKRCCCCWPAASCCSAR